METKQRSSLLAFNKNGLHHNKEFRIAIASGKGGTGKTFIATNLFFALYQESLAAGLADCDAEAPNDMLFFSGKDISGETVFRKIAVVDEEICRYCGACHDACQFNAILMMPDFGICRVHEELCHDCGACKHACNFGAITFSEIPAGEIRQRNICNEAVIFEAKAKLGLRSPVKLIRKTIKTAISSKILIIDCPPGTSCPLASSCYHADYVIIVTEPTPFGLSDLKLTAQMLKKMEKKIGVVINRSTGIFPEMQEYLKQENLPLLLEIQDQQNISKYISEGELITRYSGEWRDSMLLLFSKITESLWK